MRGETTGVPRRMARVRPEQCNGGFSHEANIVTAASRYEWRSEA